MKLNFFFDIDGTLLPFGQGVPKSALEAITKARSLGHRIFLSTGRSVPEISESLSVIPIDGGIYSAGALVKIGDKEIFKRSFNDEERRIIFDIIKEMNLEVLLQTDQGTYMTQASYDYFVEMMLKYVGRILDIPNCKVAEELPYDLEIDKLLFFSRTGEVEKVRDRLNGNFVVVNNTVGLPQEYMAEIVLPNITKATGIEEVIKYLGESRESTVAVGDGANDIEMVEYAALGIAMGNSSDDLKRVADFITDDVDKDGLAKAIEYALNR